MVGLTWLHLSDWHQKGKDFDRKLVRDKLIKDIENRKNISQDLAEINFIVFSGDVAFSGLPEEYQAAKKELFDPVLKACDLDPENLFIVPGNHDLNRAKFDLLPVQLSKPLDSDIQAKEWLFDRKKRSYALVPFEAFTNFVSRYTHQKNPNYANIRQYDIDGKQISLLGFNSAWMCGRRKDSKGEIDDKGVVVVGEPQIHETLDKVSEYDIKIAILHHPFSWLADFESSQIERSLMEDCDIILRGHQHEPQVSFIYGTNGECVTIPAGACYDHRNYANAYNFVHLNLENGQGVVFLRCWNGKDKWREDIDSSNEGKFEFNIYESSSKNRQLNVPSGQFDGPVASAGGNAVDMRGATGPICKLKGQMNQNLTTQIIKPAEKFPVPHQIPSPRNFTGREELIDRILTNFAQGDTVIALRGIGGLGKTALAYKLAELLRGRYLDGQLMVNLQGTSTTPFTPAQAMSKLLRYYYPAVPLPENEDELQSLYLSTLDGKCVLILLDNALDENQVRPFLPPASCGLIVTSRHKFALSGMVPIDLDILKLEKAVELLLKTARPYSSRPLSQEEPTWKEIARMCGCIPVALKAAGSYLACTPGSSPKRYIKELQDERKRLGIIGKEGVEEDLVTKFSLSYCRLAPETAKVFRLLSIFPGDFDAHAEEAICQDEGHRHLIELERWSLVEYQRLNPEDEGRYHLLDLVRLFAAGRMEESGGEAARNDAQQHHAEYFKDVLFSATKLYVEGDALAGLRRFDLERMNIEAGWSWAKSNLVGNNAAASLCNAFLDWPYLLVLRMHPRERVSWLEMALAAARQLEDKMMEGVHLGNLGNAYSDMGEVRKAIEYYEQALAILREIGHKLGEGIDLANLGLAYFDLGEVRKAIEYYNQALAIARKIGTLWIEGENLCNLGKAYAAMGETEKAIGYYDQSLEIVRRIEDRKNESVALCNLGKAYSDLGEVRKAIDNFEQSLEIARKIEYRRGEGDALFNMSLALEKLGQRPEAIDHAKAALAIFEQIESPDAEKARQKLAEWQG